MSLLTPRELARRGQLYQQLAQLTAAGIPVIQAFELLSRNPPSGAYREPLERIINELKSGSTVAGSFQNLGKWVPEFDIALIGAGEQSGRLDSVFGMLSRYYEERARLLRRMLSDLAYPVFLFHFAIVLFPFIDWFGGKMSGVQLGIKVGTILGGLYVVVGFLIFSFMGKRGAQWRAMLEKIVRPIPLLGPARHSLALARLSAALEALISAGMNIIQAWELAALSSGSQAIYQAVVDWRPELDRGITPAETVKEASAQFPEVFANLYHSGEVSGQLDDALRRLHKYYQEEATHKFQILGEWFPKIVYFGVAGMVGYKVIGFWSNYFGQIQELTK